MKQFTELRTADSPSNEAPVAAKLLGTQLREDGKLSEQDIKDVVSTQRRDKGLFGEVAVKMGLVSEEAIRDALSKQYQYPVASQGAGSHGGSLVTSQAPFSPAAEAFRTLRSQLMIRWYGDKKNTLAVTGTRHGCGASTVAANLAIVFAQAGHRTLLIDANLRQPSQGRFFGLASTEGLSTLLSGRCSADDVYTVVPPFDDLYVLPAGSAPPNPQELLYRLAFSYLVETAPANFDIVIIDTPPILEYADAQLVAALTSACLLVTQRDVTRIDDVHHAKVLLEPTNAQLVGAVICES